MIVICDHDNLDAGWRCAPRCGPPARLKITARKCARYWLHRTTPRLWRGAGRRFRWLCRGRAALRLRQRLRIVAGGVLEGIYTVEGARRRGWAARLIAQVQEWAKQQGCSELASDTDIANLDSQRLHAALGFAETELVVFYRKTLV